MDKLMKLMMLMIFISTLSACSAIDTAKKLFPPDKSLASVMTPLESFKELKALPKPKGAIPVSVYAYRDHRSIQTSSECKFIFYRSNTRSNVYFDAGIK